MTTTTPATTPLPVPTTSEHDPPAGHPMITRRKDGIVQPNPLYANIANTDDVPRTIRTALCNPAWFTVMEDEYHTLKDNDTWELVPRPQSMHVMSGKWIFKYKYHVDGILERRKVCWVVCGFSQRPGLDFDQTFSPVVKPTMIHTVLYLVVARDWPIHQFDVKNAFLHGDLTEQVYCLQPTGFTDSTQPDDVCFASPCTGSSRHNGLGSIASPPICSNSASSRPSLTAPSLFCVKARLRCIYSGTSTTLCSPPRAQSYFITSSTNYASSSQ